MSSGRFHGKVAVVTASTMGIGLEVARRLACEGASVVVSSRKQQHVDEAVQRLRSDGLQRVAGVVCHVARQEDRETLLQEALRRFGGIDVLVSNAAANPADGSILQCEPQHWDKIFDVNLKSSFLLAKEVLPYIRKRGGGSIVFVSSVAGCSPMNFLGAYAVSKTALMGLTKALAAALATENIRVNSVLPGVTRTKFARNIHETETVAQNFLARIPMKRFAEPTELAGVVAFLCSEDASYITGENVVAAGGMQSRL